jgi:hypothetical protein
MYYILIFNRKTGKTEKIFPEADHTKAYKLFEEKDIAYENDPDIEVNYVSADNEEELKKIWKRFFLFV